MSKCAAGSRSVPALLAACRMSDGCTAFSAGAQALKRASCSEKNASPRSSAVAKCVISAGEKHTVGVERGLRDARRQGRVARAEAAHSRVELDVHGAAATRRHLPHERLVPRDDVGVGVERDVELAGRQRAHDEDRSVDAGVAQRRRLAGRRDRQPGRSARQRRACGGHGAVTVAVGLDDRAERSRGRARAAPAASARTHAGGITLDRREVHARDRPDCHLLRDRHRPERYSAGSAGSPCRARGNAATTSPAITPSGPCSAAATRPAAAWRRTPAHAAAKGSRPLAR